MLKTNHIRPFTVLAAVMFVSLMGNRAAAESWCAYPLWVHEWGVHVFGSDGAPAVAPAFPAYFHTPASPSAAAPQTPVRALPADNGIRTLPVVHFYSAGSFGASVPVGVEVGFAHGSAAAWFPAVDTIRPATIANSPDARAKRESLMKQRDARVKAGWRAESGTALPLDPTRQLVWDRIELTAKPPRDAAATDVPWVKAARQLDALWTTSRGETERFVFYEAGTDEKTPLRIRRGETYGPKRHHYILENTGPFDIHDVLFVHREGRRLHVFHAPKIPAGKSAGFLMEEHVAPDDGSRTTALLRQTLVNPTTPKWPIEVNLRGGDCVMGRDPAIPTENAASHHLFDSEVTLILDVWAKRFFQQQGTTILYREDLASLNAAMPLSIYTDMFNHVILNRAGLALWEGVRLP